VSFWPTEADTGTSTVFVDEKCRFEIAPRRVITTKAAESFAAFAVHAPGPTNANHHRARVREVGSEPGLWEPGLWMPVIIPGHLLHYTNPHNVTFAVLVVMDASLASRSVATELRDVTLLLIASPS
jgi:hypothetical protein